MMRKKPTGGGMKTEAGKARVAALVAPDAPADDRLLTPMQLAFVDHYMASGNIRESALKAGYSEAMAQAKSYQFLENPRIVAEIRKRQSRAVNALVPVAIEAIKGVLLDPGASPRDKLAAAKTVLDRTGYPAMSASVSMKGNAEKPLYEMGLDELETYMAGLREKKSALEAVVIDVEAVEVEPDVSDLDPDDDPA